MRPRSSARLLCLLHLLLLAGRVVAGSASRRLSAAEDTTGSLYSSAAYAYFYGAPAATRVPLVVGFTTANLTAYTTSTRSKVKIAVATGVDFSGFGAADLLDAWGFPDITYLASSTTEVQLFLETESLKPATSYELTLEALTGAASATLASVEISWYTYDATANKWLQLERSTQNDGGFGGGPDPHGHLVGASLKTSTRSIAGTSVMAAWSSSGTMLTVLLDVRLSPVVAGVVSIMLGPASLWDFAASGNTITDGQPCPDGSYGGVEGQASGALVPPGVTYCFMRKRGRHVNSVDLHVTADWSGGASVKLFLPKPTAGTFGPWWASFREDGSAPGYQVLALPIAQSARVQGLSPLPEASIVSFSASAPGTRSGLQLSFRAGATMSYLTNSHFEVRIDAAKFAIEEYGCSFASGSRPFGSVVRTVTASNMCVVMWASLFQEGTGTIAITSSGEVTGTGVDFHSPSVVGLTDSATIDGSAFHYLLASGNRYVVRARTVASGTGVTMAVLAAASSNLVGAGTKFSSGTFDQKAEVGDYVLAGGRSFVITAVNSDTSCDVTESGAAPSTALAATAFVVSWKTRLRVNGFSGETSSLTVVAAGTSFALERAGQGVAFWSRTYGLKVSGVTSSTATAVLRPVLRVYSGRDDNADRAEDMWSTAFGGDSYRLKAPAMLLEVGLYPTTVSAAAKARIVLAFTTAESSLFTGGVQESLAHGMVLRIFTRYFSQVRFHMANGQDFDTATTEAEALDCSKWILEMWQDGNASYPHPKHCWWDARAQVPHSVYMRFEPGRGLRSYTRYEFVFLATLQESANGVSDLVYVEVADGGAAAVVGAVVNTGSAGVSKTLVRQPIAGADREPIVRAFEVIGAESLKPGAPLRVRLQSGANSNNFIVALNIVRIFLMPLTAWSVGATCSAARSDGGLVECAVEQTGRNSNTIVMTLDQNSPSIGSTSQTIFNITGIALPANGFFRGELGVEVWSNPRETTRYMASYLSSAAGRLAAMNFVSVQVSGGVARLMSYSAPLTRELSNVVRLSYALPATCLSTASMPCRLVITVPSAFRVLSGAAPTSSGTPPAMPLPLLGTPACDVELGTCALDVAGGIAMWAGTAYEFSVTVANPSAPLPADSGSNRWAVTLSGSNGWDFGIRETAVATMLPSADAFAVQGRLTLGVVQPDTLRCGSTSVLRVHFVAEQRVPAGGVVRLTAPTGYIYGGIACEPKGLLNWPSTTTCSAAGSVATIVVGSSLDGAGSFHIFTIKVAFPSEGPGVGVFKIETSSATTPLDVAADVTWSAQVTSAGQRVFSDALGCWPQGIRAASVEVSNMLPYSVVEAAATATITWKGLSVTDSPVSIDIYAPAGYKWHDGAALSTAVGGVTAPVGLDPNHALGPTVDDANLMRLLTTAPLDGSIRYGIKAPIRVPDAQPGIRQESAASGSRWYVTFGNGATSAAAAQRIAAAVLTETSGIVRKISSFEVRRSSRLPQRVAALTATFATVQALPQGGVVLLELPAGFAFGAHRGSDCVADSTHAQGGEVPIWPAVGELVLPQELPQDATLSCVASSAAASGNPAFMWSVGASGLAAGAYVLTVFVRNPLQDVGGAFRLRTFLDAAQTSIGDVSASAELQRLATPLPRAAVVMEHVDPGSGLLDLHAGRTTWVPVAFELAVDLPPDFSIQLRAPLGFEVPWNCAVHIGNGSTFTPLGVDAATLSEAFSQYILFPPSMRAECTGHGREAHIAVAPTDFGVMPSFPSVAGKMYVFRLQVVNAQVTPIANEWVIRVSDQISDQEFSAIPGYGLWEFRAMSITPKNTAASDATLVTVGFWSRSAVRGIFGVRNGIFVLEAPPGFQVKSQNGRCSGYTGLRNHSGVVGSAVACEVWPTMPRKALLHNRLSYPLEPAVYSFEIEVINPAVPAAALDWQLKSYFQETARDADLLDVGSVRGYEVNTRLLSFVVEPLPAGQQLSGQAVTLRFALMLSHAVLRGDALVLRAPVEYAFSCSLGAFSSDLLPAPTCSGSTIAFAFSSDSDSGSPAILPSNSEGATVVTFSLATSNPSRKPARNILGLAHCRGIAAGASAVPVGEAACPAGATVVASLQQRLWPIVARIGSTSVELAALQGVATGALGGFTVSAQNQSSNVRIRFALSSAGASKIKVECQGMDFRACGAVYQGLPAQCQGSAGSATVTPSTGAIAAAGLGELVLSSVVNPAGAGPTAWRLTTYGPDPEDPTALMIFDQSDLIEGYPVVKYLVAEPVRECTPQLLLQPSIAETWFNNCTSRSPWLGQAANSVVLRFSGFQSGDATQGHWLLLQPPAGFAFSASSPAVPLSGPDWLPGPLPGTYAALEQVVRDASGLPIPSTVSSLASSVLLIKLAATTPMTSPFSIMFGVDNPFIDSTFNLWRFALLSPDLQRAVYTNDGIWPGFALRGAFTGDGRTSVKSLVTAFPSETNVVRLQMSLASALSGSHLQVRVSAPAGFVFASECLTERPDYEPAPAPGGLPWVTKCSNDVSNRHIATLQIPNVGTGGGLLEKDVAYAVNLMITNAKTFNADSNAVWEMYTFRNNDNSRFVHYTALPSFQLEVLWARVAPESPKIGASSLLFVSFRPMRDLGPHGQLVLHAPQSVRLFCRLRPYFVRGNLPGGVSCAGANNYALVQLSGGDFLERGVPYQFALRVTNPAAIGDMMGDWAIRLQTQERELIHETSQVSSYALTKTAISRFAIAPVSHSASTPTWIKVHFKLETPMARAGTNMLELTAPEAVRFPCADAFLKEGFVLPSAAIRPGGLPLFADLGRQLEPAAARELDAYRNEGTTEDGRSIVDCRAAGVVRLAVDFTDDNTLGRYAFEVEVRNPPQTPALNVWSLRSFSDGQFVEEGATGGYEVSAYITDALDMQPTPAPSPAAPGPSAVATRAASAGVAGPLCLALLATLWSLTAA